MSIDLVEFYKKLRETEKVEVVTGLIESLESEYGSRFSWMPIGGRGNNSGPIQISSDEGRSLVERVTNGVDAILEREHDIHRGIPDCRTPKEAAASWLSIPSDKGLSGWTTVQRREFATRNLIVRLLPGEHKDSRVVEIIDNGIGISAEDMPKTILSLNEDNKMQKLYTVGIYGQGGSSTFAASMYTLIVSKKNGVNKIAFSVVAYIDLPPDKFKSGFYAYLAIDGKVPEIDADKVVPFESGTLVKHFGYHLERYSNPLGTRSVYGLLNRVLFDPLVPVWLDNRIHTYGRTIKGSRNALNGAVDDTDEEKSGPELLYNQPMFYVIIADFGQVGIEYWVLKETDRVDAFVSPTYPILFTLNGQNHAEFGKGIIRDSAGLPYLARRMIVHLNCDGISFEGKRQLFVSTREGYRGGVVLDLIINEIVNALKNDDKLMELNNEIMQTTVFERSDEDAQTIRREVAKILNMQGVPVKEIGQGASSNGSGPEMGRTRRSHSRTLRNIELHDPPTYIKILWDSPPITFYPSQRRYIRIETDAPSNYYDVNPARNRINVVVEGVTNSGSVPLSNGRMRVVVDASSSASAGTKGRIRVELTRQGLPALFDEKETEIVNIPPSPPRPTTLTLPEFYPIPIDRTDSMWDTLGWPDELSAVASQTVRQENGSYKIYYSKEFPTYKNAKDSFERRRVDLGKLFTKRYEIWVSAYALLYQRDVEKNEEPNQNENSGLSDEIKIKMEMKEKCRAAIIAAQFASKEVEQLTETSIPK